jgi:hypothetical protein
MELHHVHLLILIGRVRNEEYMFNHVAMGTNLV